MGRAQHTIKESIKEMGELYLLDVYLTLRKLNHLDNKLEEGKIKLMKMNSWKQALTSNKIKVNKD